MLNSPVLSQRKLRQVLAMRELGVNPEYVDLQYDPGEGLEQALTRICDQAEQAVRSGKMSGMVLGSSG